MPRLFWVLKILTAIGSGTTVNVPLGRKEGKRKKRNHLKSIFASKQTTGLNHGGPKPVSGFIIVGEMVRKYQQRPQLAPPLQSARQAGTFTVAGSNAVLFPPLSLEWRRTKTLNQQLDIPYIFNGIAHSLFVAITLCPWAEWMGPLVRAGVWRKGRWRWQQPTGAGARWD